MFTLVTGLPGAGKTLRAIYEVKALSEKENRPVYYFGISDLKLPWFELDKPEDWFKCPPGAIILIDEAQRTFRPRANSAQVPVHVEKAETHRHQGHDVFLTTQHPMLIDSNIRRLCGRHLHVVRAFGAKAANLHEWGEVKEYCDKARTGSIETFWKYPAEVFTYYKSAEVHTHKFRLPPRVFFLLVVPFVVAACAWALYRWWQPRLTGQDHRERVGQVTQANGKPAAAGTDSKAKKTAEEYLADLTPRIPGLLHTAAVYDSVTTPVEAPIPMCYSSSKSGCRCFDQQGNRYYTHDETCRYIVKNGLFIGWKTVKPGGDASPSPVRQDEPKTAGAVSVPVVRNEAPMPVPSPQEGVKVASVQ